MTAVEIARQFLFVRELPDNKGQRVEAIQRWGGGVPGDPWCAFFATFVLDIRDQGKCPLTRTGSCDVILTLARQNKWIVASAEPGDLYLYVRGQNDAYHVGVVTRSAYQHSIKGLCFDGLSGNTSEDGTSANGDRVAERPIRYDSTKHVFVRVPNAV